MVETSAGVRDVGQKLGFPYWTGFCLVWFGFALGVQSLIKYMGMPG